LRSGDICNIWFLDILFIEKANPLTTGVPPQVTGFSAKSRFAANKRMATTTPTTDKFGRIFLENQEGRLVFDRTFAHIHQGLLNISLDK